MPIKFAKKAKNSFHIAVGEEGIVVAYCNDGVSKAKLFVRSIDDNDTGKLKQLLLSDPIAPIYIYVDTLDQTYVQRAIPTAGTLGIANLARKRLEKETPKNHLKACVQLERLPTGRRDFVYTFMSTPVEAPLTTWLDFFLPYMNIIQGIYLLPVEIHGIIQKLRAGDETIKTVKVVKTKKAELKDQLTKIIPGIASASNQTKAARWELFLSHHKTGGFRQVAFHDGKIIFSRLLNNINHPDPDVVAGNIEQEISNSIEYLVRLSISGEESIDMYLILSEEIQKFIRIEKLKATKVFQFTPYKLAQTLRLKDAAGEKDKFADPPLLTAFSTIAKRKLTLHTPITQRVFSFTQNTARLRTALNILIPITIVTMLAVFDSIFSIRTSLSYLSSQLLAINSLVATNTKVIEETEGKIGQNIKIDHLNEIVDFYLFMTQELVNPMDFAIKLGRILPDMDRVKLLRWNFVDQGLFHYKSTEKNKLPTMADIGAPRKYTITSEIELVLKNYGSTVEELQKKYQELGQILISSFPDYRIELSDLPDIIGLQAGISQPTTITAKFIRVYDPELLKTKTPSPGTLPSGDQSASDTGAKDQIITFGNDKLPTPATKSSEVKG